MWNVIRLIIWSMICTCLAWMIRTGIVNGVALIALILVGLLAATYPSVRRYFTDFSATDPTDQRSRLDDLDRPAAPVRDDAHQ